MTEYEIRGLYGGAHLIEAETEADAREQFHKQHPGWAGTIFSAKEVDQNDG